MEEHNPRLATHVLVDLSEVSRKTVRSLLRLVAPERVLDVAWLHRAQYGLFETADMVAQIAEFVKEEDEELAGPSRSLKRP